MHPADILAAYTWSVAIRVLIVDDEVLVRQALRIFVGADSRTEVIGEAVDGASAAVLCDELAPDVVLMDIQMPGVNGIDATAAIVDANPYIKVLALTTFSSERNVVSMLRAGASGYLVKDTTPQDLVRAIVDVCDGRSVLSPSISRELISAVRGQTTFDGANEHSNGLTRRELSIVHLLAQGMSNAEIADELHLAEATIKANFGRIMVKWDVRDRVQVLIHAARLGLILLE